MEAVENLSGRNRQLEEFKNEYTFALFRPTWTDNFKSNYGEQESEYVVLLQTKFMILSIGGQILLCSPES